MTISASTSSSTSILKPVTGWGVSYVAQAAGPRLSVYSQPGALTPALTVDNPWRADPARPDTSVPQVFLVEAQRDNGWIRVRLPIRPNGSSGWVRSADVTISPVAYRLTIQLSAHRLTVLDRGQVTYTGTVAVGAPSTPTPTGHYYIRVLIKAPNPNTVYGPYAYGLSSHSNTLNTFDGADAEIGIHGNDNPAVLGTNVTHGCIRIDNTEITQLANTLPLGTPVDITT